MKARDQGRATGQQSKKTRRKREDDSASAYSRAKKMAKTTPAVGSADALDGSDLFSPPASPNAIDQRNAVLGPPSPGPPPDHMVPHPEHRIKLKTLRSVDRPASTTIDDLFEPQTACGHSAQPAGAHAAKRVSGREAVQTTMVRASDHGDNNGIVEDGPGARS